MGFVVSLLNDSIYIFLFYSGQNKFYSKVSIIFELWRKLKTNLNIKMATWANLISYFFTVSTEKRKLAERKFELHVPWFCGFGQGTLPTKPHPLAARPRGNAAQFFF